jgi:hypothetical protein
VSSYAWSFAESLRLPGVRISLDTSLRGGCGRVVGEPLVVVAIGVGIEQVELRIVRTTAERIVGQNRIQCADVERESIANPIL